MIQNRQTYLEVLQLRHFDFDWAVFVSCTNQEIQKLFTSFSIFTEVFQQFFRRRKTKALPSLKPMCTKEYVDAETEHGHEIGDN